MTLKRFGPLSVNLKRCVCCIVKRKENSKLQRKTASMSALLPKGQCGLWLRAQHTPVSRPGGGKACPKADSPHPRQAGRESLHRQGRGREPHAETAPSAVTVIFRLAIDGLTSAIVVVLATVNLQFRGHLFPFL